MQDIDNQTEENKKIKETNKLFQDRRVVISGVPRHIDELISSYCKRNGLTIRKFFLRAIWPFIIDEIQSTYSDDMRNILASALASRPSGEVKRSDVETVKGVLFSAAKPPRVKKWKPGGRGRPPLDRTLWNKSTPNKKFNDNLIPRGDGR